MTGYTPTTFRINKEVFVDTFENIGDYSNNPWMSLENDENIPEIKQLDNFMIWSSRKWTILQSITRHRINQQKVLRIETFAGTVDLTSDTCYFDAENFQISLEDVQLGQHLNHNFIQFSYETSNEETNPDFDIIQKFLEGSPQVQILKYHSLIKEYILEKVATSDYRERSQLWRNIHCQLRNCVYAAEKYFHSQIHEITKITEIKYTGYLYDVTTLSGCFAAGKSKSSQEFQLGFFIKKFSPIFIDS